MKDSFIALPMSSNDRINNWELVKTLRSEAISAKKDFTTLLFQTLAFSSASMGFILTFAKNFHTQFLIAIPVILLLMIVGRIGMNKYATANRNFGYELHLSRVNELSREYAWNKAWRLIEWEEALRAWRVVQIRVFREVYETRENQKGGVSKEKWGDFIYTLFDWLNPKLYKVKKSAKEEIALFKDEKKCESGNAEKPSKYPWFMPKELTYDGKNENYNYFTGSFLKNSLQIILISQVTLLWPAIWNIFTKIANMIIEQSCPQGLSMWVFISEILGMILMGRIIYIRHRRTSRRREILENEMLSIHSCSIMWQVVITAHFSVLSKNTHKTYLHYTENLVKKSEEIIDNIYTIDQWLKNEGRKLKYGLS